MQYAVTNQRCLTTQLLYLLKYSGYNEFAKDLQVLSVSEIAKGVILIPVTSIIGELCESIR